MPLVGALRLGSRGPRPRIHLHSNPRLLADNCSNTGGRAQFLYTRERCGKSERWVVENTEGEENKNKDKTSTVKPKCWKSSYDREKGN